MWNDKETDSDLLGHRTLARTIKSLIQEVELSPLTIGVYGDWGAGKSSVLRMIENELEGDRTTSCVSFNGWLFQGYDDTKSVVMEAVINELRQKQPANKKLQEKASSLLKRIDWLKLTRTAAGLAMTGLTGIPDPALIGTLLEKVKSALESPTQALTSAQIGSIKDAIGSAVKEKVDERTVPEEISAFRTDFEELLETAKIDRLVVLVDDLDRCLPETAIAILEAIRLFLYVPGTVFVLAADEDMIAYAVRKHFPDLPVSVGPTDYTRNYLEKLIQVPFRVPPLGKTETRTYITLLLAEQALSGNDEFIRKVRNLADKIFTRPWEGKELDEKLIKDELGGIPEKLKHALLLADRISAVLAEGLNGNPRQIKRFLNTLMVRLRIASAQGIAELINEDALAKMMLLERFNESFYKDLLRMIAASNDGRSLELAAFEKFVRETGIDDVEKNDGTEEKGSEAPKDWIENSWLIAWSKSDPLLGALDLRPYFYISREKSPGFTTSMGLAVELNQIAEKLATGNQLLLTAAEKEVKELGILNAKKIFQYLLDRARQNPNWRTKPSEIDGLYSLCKIYPELQEDLVSALEDIPAAELGPWVVTGTKGMFQNDPVKGRFEELKTAWLTQTENGSLRKAVETLGNL